MKCPQCQEQVRKEDAKCPFCGCELPGDRTSKHKNRRRTIIIVLCAAAAALVVAFVCVAVFRLNQKNHDAPDKEKAASTTAVTEQVPDITTAPTTDSVPKEPEDEPPPAATADPDEILKESGLQQPAATTASSPDAEKTEPTEQAPVNDDWKKGLTYDAENDCYYERGDGMYIDADDGFYYFPDKDKKDYFFFYDSGEYYQYNASEERCYLFDENDTYSGYYDSDGFHLTA